MERVAREVGGGLCIQSSGVEVYTVRMGGGGGGFLGVGVEIVGMAVACPAKGG